jgi:hypothetical protein
MENQDRAAHEERKWRTRVATAFLAGFVLGWGMLAVSLLVTGANEFQVLIGLFLLIVLTVTVAYYFGAVVKRIEALPFPEPRYAGIIGRRIAWVFAFPLAVGIFGVFRLMSGSYGSLPSPRREIVAGGVAGGLCLILFLAFALYRWRAAIIKIGEGASGPES